MGCKYVKEFEFGGSTNGKYVKGYFRGGKVAGADCSSAAPAPKTKPTPKMMKGGPAKSQKC